MESSGGGIVIYLKGELREQELIDSLEIVEAIKDGLSKTGFQCGECEKFLSCSKVAQQEFCLEWEFFTCPGRPCESQNLGP